MRASPAGRADPIQIVTPIPASDPRIAAYAAARRAQPGVADVMRGGVSAIDVIPAGSTQGRTADRLVQSLREHDVFLLSRIKEAHDEHRDTDAAVADRLQRSGRIITSAAFLIMIVFLGFAAGQTLGIKEMGLVLAIAVAVDATSVRSLLVPATMTLLGRANWWAPAPLRRLHDRIGLHEAAQSVPPAPAGRVEPEDTAPRDRQLIAV